MAIHIKASHKGLLHKNLGVPEGEPIPHSKIEKAEHSSSPAVRKRAVFAENASHWHHGGHKLSSGGSHKHSMHYEPHKHHES